MADVKIENEEKKTENVAALYGPQYLDRMNASADALDKIGTQRPADYSSKYQPQIDLAMEKVLNRPSFHYDVNGDALYQMYKDQYARMGRTAMQDTMGQAAALTGGYGSTYGQRVGQQTYDQYMQGLTDKIPELYQLALDKYDRDYAYDKDRLSILDAADQKDYGRWGDDMRIWQNDRSYQAGRYDTDASMAMTAADAMFTRLQALIAMGYQPTEDELQAAGMTADQVLALQGKLKPSGGGGGGRRKQTAGDIAKTANGLLADGYAAGAVGSYYLKDAFKANNLSKRDQHKVINSLNLSDPIKTTYKGH